MANLSLDPPRAPEEWAEVRANDRVMRYRRSGTGRSIVILLATGHRKPPWPELLEALRSRFRVILPEPPEADADIADWLADFLEGLGMANVAIVAADRFCIPVVELTLLGLDQVARVALVPHSAGGALEAVPEHARVPLTVVREGHPVEETVRLLARFLAA